jgi:hypothetical protein
LNEAAIRRKAKVGRKYRTVQISPYIGGGKQKMASGRDTRNFHEKDYSSRGSRRRFLPKAGLGLDAIRQMLDENNDDPAQESLRSDRLTLMIPHRLTRSNVR